MRSYSLINPEAERHRYVIAVQRDKQGRGGSKWIHQNLRAGEILSVSPPRNNFQLNETAEKSIFIAGGSGVTPMLSMIDRLNAVGREWEMVYCSRTRAATPFLKLLESNPRVRVNFDQERYGKMLDIAALVQATPSDVHIYCCGPLPMLEAFEQATKNRAPDLVHVEYFTAAEPPATEGGFKIVLAKSGAINGLDLDLQPGQIHGLIGPNSSGKTTTLNVISGYYAARAEP